jgi:hypothetical protein
MEVRGLPVVELEQAAEALATFGPVSDHRCLRGDEFVAETLVRQMPERIRAAEMKPTSNPRRQASCLRACATYDFPTSAGPPIRVVKLGQENRLDVVVCRAHPEKQCERIASVGNQAGADPGRPRRTRRIDA